jgi:hypothetical protein
MVSHAGGRALSTCPRRNFEVPVKSYRSLCRVRKSHRKHKPLPPCVAQIVRYRWFVIQISSNNWLPGGGEESPPVSSSHTRVFRRADSERQYVWPLAEMFGRQNVHPGGEVSLGTEVKVDFGRPALNGCAIPPDFTLSVA